MADRGPVSRRAPEQDAAKLPCLPVENDLGQLPSGQASAAHPFARSARLRTRSQLEYVKTHGPRRAGRHCVVSIACPPDARRRFAIITSRRYSKRAVDRNRARRLLRETYRLLLPRMRDIWVVFIPRRAMLRAGLGDVLPEVESALTRLGVLEPVDPCVRANIERGIQ